MSIGAMIAVVVIGGVAYTAGWWRARAEAAMRERGAYRDGYRTGNADGWHDHRRWQDLRTRNYKGTLYRSGATLIRR
jgi:hypothetical protein